jgi:orotidine-5'-phosphate decarboxylase
VSFYQAIAARAKSVESCICVGLDPDVNKLPRSVPRNGEGVLRFLTDIVDATADIACVYKPNLAFFGALGTNGLDILKRVRDRIPSDVPVILDLKAGDIGNTADRYAEMAYDVIGADAVTVNAYMGFDAVGPFMRPGRCAFILCLTSNETSADFQRLSVERPSSRTVPLYVATAETCNEWLERGEIGLVVGATHPAELAEIRQVAPALPFLIPGVGTQGGDAQDVVRQGSFDGGGGILINASRSILYASSGDDYATAARVETEALREATTVSNEA